MGRGTAALGIRTTVAASRHECSLRGGISLPVPGGIRTTVSELKSKAAVAAAAAARADVSSLVLISPPAAAASSIAGCSSDKAEQPIADSSSSSSESRSRWSKAAMEVLLPTMLQAPLQLASPFAGLAGVAMAGAPLMPPPPPMRPMPRNAMQMLPPGLQEEEPFAALIFPGFESGAFVWQITCWQIAEFVISMLMGHNHANPTPCVLYRLGASWGPAVARGQIWRLVTPVMLHANLTHLLFNVFFQLRMGFGMEKQFGREKMMMIYFACGLFGNLVSISLDPFKLAVGASTAGFGLIGVWLAEILLSWEILGPARERTVIWIAFMLISVTTMSSMTPNMDLWGHLGGALGGFLLSIIISDMKEEDKPAWYNQAKCAAALGLALCLTGGLTKAMLINPKDPIPDCELFKALSSAVASATNAGAAVTQ